MGKTLTPLIDRVSNEQLLVKARESVRKLWLCGLGAYSLATKSGVRTFDSLIREGQAIRPKARQQIEEKSVELMNNASATLQRSEQLVKERFLRPLDFVLLATRRDIEQLSLRVIQLSTEVHSLATGKAKPMAKPLNKPAIRPAAKTDTTQAPPMISSAA
ncbi:phasin family protein [Accumulibacter sp.]|uniref:phasin family protein n=1 Tax=Accumulibacter sp. TaxID=2053492 RepID=UPI001A4F98BC|nr:phasin family protein [Accumulibacter sp.]MBL8375560.1 phasin family protein [Accumulibacter sp.]